jgi:hypothetical protein
MKSQYKSTRIVMEEHPVFFPEIVQRGAAAATHRFPIKLHRLNAIHRKASSLGLSHLFQ